MFQTVERFKVSKITLVVMNPLFTMFNYDNFKQPVLSLIESLDTNLKSVLTNIFGIDMPLLGIQ